LLVSDLAREAVDALRGYDWQRWLTVERWLGITGEEALWIEWGEDITIARVGEARTIQAKDLKAAITLGQAKIRDLISKALLRGPAVQTIIWTRAQPGLEKGAPFNEPGIVHWRKVVAGEDSAEKLKRFLTKPDRLAAEAAARILETPDDALPALLAKLEWVTGEAPIAGLRERVLPLVETRLSQLQIANASVLRDDAAARLFEVVAEVSTREDRQQRRLTRPDLDRLLVRRHLDALAASAPTLQEAITGQHQATPGLAEAIERDFARRYNRATQRSLFPECGKADEFSLLAQELTEGDFTGLSTNLRRRILLRAARSRAARRDVAEAKYLMSAALQLEGSDSELPALARVTAAEGDLDGAIRLLRDQDDADCRSTLLSLLAHHKGDDAALSWVAGSCLIATDFSAGGVLALCQTYIHKNDFEGLARTSAQISEKQCLESPYLFLFRGIVRFAATLAVPDRPKVLGGIPLDVRFVQPILPDSELQGHLDQTILDLQRLRPIASDLGLPEAARTAEVYVRWCELLHPRHKQAALAKLRNDMEELQTAIVHVQFALAYDSGFDPKPLAVLLEKREALGGMDDDELRAALILRLHGDDPRPVAKFIGTYRARCESSIGQGEVAAIEIQALALAKEVASARLLLDARRNLFSPELVALLDAEILKAQGSDPVEQYRTVYEKTKTPEALRALVNALAEKQDYLGIARYAQELYARTADPNDITMAARALAKVGDDETFLRIAETYPFVEERDPFLARHHAWLLFRLGRLNEAKQFTSALRTTDPKSRDLDLEIAIAVESGAWETLGATLQSYLDTVDDRSGLALIRAAHLAQTAGQGPMLALMEAAVQKSPDDPNVLLGAYTLVLEEALEEKKPVAADWFSRALDLSGPDGPVKRFELKDLLSQHKEWSEHTRKINEAIFRGDMPMLVAAPGLRTTLVDVILRNFARNSKLADRRRCTAVPLFCGRRSPTKLSACKGVALDLSALMTMGWLGILPKVIASHAEVLIPAFALAELFEGRRRIREFQKSRLVRARQLRDAISAGRLKVKRSLGFRNSLEKEVGIELGTLVRAAEADDGTVVRPAPVHKLGTFEEQADLSTYAARLADMRSLLTVLVDHGAIDQPTEDAARKYFEVQDKGWPASAVPKTDKPLFLDGLAVTYLQSVNLLNAVLDTFHTVYVDASTEDDATSIFEHEQHTTEVLRTIDEICDAIRNANEAGKITFGPHKSRANGDESHLESASLNLLADLRKFEIVVFDDRAINKELFAADRTNHRARIVTSLDVIEDLLSRGLLTENERRALRHRLRLAGAVLVPADAEEIVAAALRNRQNESPEFRAIRESFDIARIAEIPRFPGEISWFASISVAVKSATMAVWTRERDTVRAARLADTILDLRPKPEDWVGSWSDRAPPNWIETVTRVITASLALPIEIENMEIVQRYNEWLERKVLAPMRATAPDRYRTIVDYLKTFFVEDREDEDANPAA